MRSHNKIGAEPIRVLMIDESSEFVQSIQDQIEINSHLFKIACKHIEEISEASKTLNEWNPNLVVIDYANSPLISAQIVKNCHQRDVPIIVTGEHNSKEIHESAEKIGALAYVVKSEDPDELGEVVELFAKAAKEVSAIH